MNRHDSQPNWNDSRERRFPWPKFLRQVEWIFRVFWISTCLFVIGVWSFILISEKQTIDWRIIAAISGVAVVAAAGPFLIRWFRIRIENALAKRHAHATLGDDQNNRTEKG